MAFLNEKKKRNRHDPEVIAAKMVKKLQKGEKKQKEISRRRWAS